MKLAGLIHQLPKNVRFFLLFFTLALSFGYFFGFKFLMRTTNLSASGVEQNYNGNEEDEDAKEMKFKKSEREIITIIHTHVISMSLIFFALASILSITSINEKLKSALMIEPFISIIATFGGVWLLWKDIAWMKYVIVVSGTLMTTSFILIVVVILSQLLRKK